MLKASVFEKKYSDYLTVYKIPVGPNQLDPYIFNLPETGEEPKLLPAIHNQITRDLEMFAGEFPSMVKQCCIIGGAVIPSKSNTNKEIRVVVVLNKDLISDLDGVLAEKILETLKALSNNLATGTTKKITYTPSLREIDETIYRGVYDVLNHRWMKLPNGLHSC